MINLAETIHPLGYQSDLRKKLNVIRTSAKSQFWTFVIGFLTIVVITSFFNIYFNPYSTFSDFQFEKKMVHSDRVSKYNRVKEMKKKPECFVMGSSNSMRFLPETIDSLLGLSAFNFGVFHARVEDFWCISNVLLKDLKCHPKLILFCLDDWNFADEPMPPDEVFVGAEKRLAYKSIYSKYLDDYSSLKLKWFQFKSSINIDQTEASFKILLDQLQNHRSWTKKVADISETFYDNGVRKRYGILGRDDDISQEAEAGQLNVTEQLRKTHNDWKKYPITKDGILSDSHEMFENFSERRLRLFFRTIALLEEANCKVIFNIMPIQPYYRSLVVANSNYIERMKLFLGYLFQIKKQFSNVLLVQDNSEISNFSGFENHFFDHIHPTSVNSDLMIMRIADSLNLQDAF